MGRERNFTGSIRRPSLVAAAAGTHNAVSTEELLAAGLSRRQIQHLAASGFLFQKHRGVWAIGRPELDFAGSCRAALLACGPGAAVSHISAARWHGIRNSTGRIHVSAPRSRGEHPGLWVHRPRSLPLADVVEHDGIAVTTVARTLLDMAPGADVDTVGRWIHNAGVQEVLDLRAIHAVLKRHPGRRGARVLEAALSVEVALTRSGLEDAYRSIWQSLRLPPVESNWNVWSTDRWEECDFLCFELGLIIETDGGRYHWSRYRRRKDAEKTQRLRDVGWIVRRFSGVEVALEPGWVAAETLRLATRGRRMKRHGYQSRPTL